MSLGENIAARRKALKLSQEYLAEHVGVSRQAVSKWETGQTEPTAKNLVRLAQLFGISVSELVEPQRISTEKDTVRRKNWKRGFEMFMVISYAASAILYTVETPDPYFPVFSSFLILISAIMMSINILALPGKVRTKTAVRELLYCITIYLIISCLEPVIRNVLASAFILIVTVIYMKYIRFPISQS